MRACGELWGRGRRLRLLDGSGTGLDARVFERHGVFADCICLRAARCGRGRSVGRRYGRAAACGAPPPLSHYACGGACGAAAAPCRRAWLELPTARRRRTTPKKEGRSLHIVTAIHTQRTLGACGQLRDRRPAYAPLQRVPRAAQRPHNRRLRRLLLRPRLLVCCMPLLCEVS